MRAHSSLSLFCIALFLPAAGCVSGSRSPEPGAASASGSARAAPVAAAPESESCARARAEIQAVFKSLPADFRDPDRPLEEVVREVEGARERAESYLRDCPPGPGRGEVEYILADFLLISFDRMVHAGEAGGLELASRALALVDDAAGSFPAGSARRADCLALTGHLLKKRSNFQVEQEAWRQDLAGMRKSFQDLLSARPDWPDRASLHNHLADSFLREGDFKKARAYLEAAREADPAVRDATSSDDKLFDALTGCGDLEAMEALVHQRLAEYPQRLERPGLSRWETMAISTWLEVGEFWLGHLRLAQGDGRGARDSFVRHIPQLEEKEARLKAAGEELGSAARIFRDFRSRDLLEYVDSFLGRRPELDFELGELWCAPQRVTLRGSRGKVVMAVFSPGDPRVNYFLKGMDALWRKERERGLEALAVAYLTRDRPPAEQVRELQEYLERLGVSMPAGFDPHPGDPRIFHSMHAIVGSASFVVFDRSGRNAWYLPDPRGLDIGVATRVIERLLAEPAPRE